MRVMDVLNVFLANAQIWLRTFPRNTEHFQGIQLTQPKHTSCAFSIISTDCAINSRWTPHRKMSGFDFTRPRFLVNATSQYYYEVRSIFYIRLFFLIVKPRKESWSTVCTAAANSRTLIHNKRIQIQNNTQNSSIEIEHVFHLTTYPCMGLRSLRLWSSQSQWQTVVSRSSCNHTLTPSHPPLSLLPSFRLADPNSFPIMTNRRLMTADGADPPPPPQHPLNLARDIQELPSAFLLTCRDPLEPPGGRFVADGTSNCCTRAKEVVSPCNYQTGVRTMLPILIGTRALPLITAPTTNTTLASPIHPHHIILQWLYSC